jgi:Delta3-Delta2-enoyl-CoA isomerase
MGALIGARLAPQAAHRTMVLGARLAAEEALALQVVDAVADEADVVGAAVARAEALAPKAGPAMATIRAGRYAAVAEVLRRPVVLG